MFTTINYQLYTYGIAIMKELELCNRGNVALTASTGIAAHNIGGLTIHKYVSVCKATNDHAHS
jgi:hypothetical protein